MLVSGKGRFLRGESLSWAGQRQTDSGGRQAGRQQCWSSREGWGFQSR